MSNRLAGRLAVSVTDRNGCARNLFTGRDVEDANRKSARTSLLFPPSDRMLVCALVANGFKSGGYNDFIGDATAVGFEPQKLWIRKVGAKAELLARP